ncbi:hypothetical protein [Actinomadura verrucosospora]|uniref:Putative Crp/Fnr family transcriptional regulator n=1 Tax=Actinomadura verrucosospora TaxID=46165 RepID=A0A7D3ZXG1_ACTVE|nr:hypothetical protein [Actinomadura verrucosospora]QKG22026.1 putative Crp/Fnr family transcriptional regulator [Actinomadura verrucosospora]
MEGSAARGPVEPLRTPATWSGLTCSVLFCDVAGFGDPARDDEDRRVVRQVTYGVLLAALEASGVTDADHYREDRGDGALVIVSPAVPTASLIDPLADRLATALRLHNHRAGAAVRVQLRVALHVGPISADAEGVSGGAIIHAARLLEAPALKDALARTGADLGLIVSPFVHDGFVAHLHGPIDPAAFERVEVKVKETTTEAWIYLSGAARTPAVPEPPAAPPSADPRRLDRSTVFHGDVHVRGDLVAGDKIVYEE